MDERSGDARILDACRRGNRDGFRALYEAHKDRVYSIAFYFFHGDAAAASDITQQVFMKLLTDIRRFRGEARFSTWLHRLVVNACLDAHRRSRRRPEVTDPEILNAQARNATHDVDFERTRMSASVRAAVDALPPRFRMVILLRYFEELSYEEIAAASHCSVGTVASRINRAHRLLARSLGQLRTMGGTRA